MKIRSSGILLHISSLPPPFGIGDMGPWAYRFADFLARAGQRYWQIIPLNPTEAAYHSSPYHSTSTFAFNPLFVSPELMVEEGLLTNKDVKLFAGISKGLAEYGAAAGDKKRLFLYIGRRIRGKEAACELVRLAMMYCANTAIIPMQDVLGLGENGRMNRPATKAGNWQWRLMPEWISPPVADKLLELTETYGRA